MVKPGLTAIGVWGLIAVFAAGAQPPAALRPPGFPDEPAEEDFALAEVAVHAPKRVYDLLEPIALDLTLTNVADVHFSAVSTRHLERDWLVLVQDEQGRHVPLTRYGRGLYGVDFVLITGGIAYVVNAGKSVNRTILLNRIYDLTIEGTYSVRASHYIASPYRPAAVQVWSEPIEIRVGRPLPELPRPPE